MSDERALLSRRPSATNTRRHPVERGNRARYRARPTAPSAEALDQVGDSTKDVTGGKTMATYVLVHGSNQGGWIWQPVANLLRAAFDLPRRPQQAAKHVELDAAKPLADGGRGADRAMVH